MRHSEIGGDGGARPKIRLSTSRRQHVESLNGHRDQTVIAKDTNQIDSGVRPKPGDRPRIQIIAYHSCQVQLAGETVDKFLIRITEGGCRILSERDNDLFGKAGFTRRLKMGLPFIGRVPDTRCGQDGELRQACLLYTSPSPRDAS